MRPEVTPLMYASLTDAAWYFGKGVCLNYSWADKDKRERSEKVIMALLAYFNDVRFADLFEIFECAKRHAEDRENKVMWLPFPDEEKAEVKTAE